MVMKLKVLLIQCQVTTGIDKVSVTTQPRRPKLPICKEWMVYGPISTRARQEMPHGVHQKVGAITGCRLMRNKVIQVNVQLVKVTVPVIGAVLVNLDASRERLVSVFQVFLSHQGSQIMSAFAMIQMSPLRLSKSFAVALQDAD